MSTAAKQRWFLHAAFLVLLLAIGLTGVSCSQNNGAPHDEQGASQHAVVYTCPMHPQIKESKPGKCPLCGMELVQKK